MQKEHSRHSGIGIGQSSSAGAIYVHTNWVRGARQEYRDAHAQWRCERGTRLCGSVPREQCRKHDEERHDEDGARDTAAAGTKCSRTIDGTLESELRPYQNRRASKED